MSRGRDHTTPNPEKGVESLSWSLLLGLGRWWNPEKGVESRGYHSEQAHLQENPEKGVESWSDYHLL